MAAAIVGGVVLAFAPDLAGVFLLGLYCVPANSVVPIPHEPAMLFFARYYDPAWIALAGTIGSLIACFSDYAMVKAAFRNRALASMASSRMYRWAARWMRRYPFAITVLFSFLPLPIAVIRVLAPATDFPIRRYMLAQVIGRFPRFYLLAWIGHALPIPTWLILALTAVMLASMFFGRTEDSETAEQPEAAQSMA